jgi:hypothetical protein
VVPLFWIFEGVKMNLFSASIAITIGGVYGLVFLSLFFGMKRLFIFDRTRKAIFKQTRIFGSTFERCVCPLSEVACVAVDSLEKTGKYGTPTGLFWYETCLILKNLKILRLHNTWEDSYEECNDAQQYAEYLECPYFAPKPGLQMKPVKEPGRGVIVKFER